MPKEEKEKLCQDYSEAYDAETRVILDDIFGKENLQPKPEIKTWKDVEFNINEHYCKLDLALGAILPTSKDDKLRLKIKATYKIAKLIELGYGGMVTEEEWRDLSTLKHIVYCTSNNNKLCIQSQFTSFKRFIAFHTRQQAAEFMSHLENVELIKQYNMI